MHRLLTARQAVALMAAVLVAAIATTGLLRGGSGGAPALEAVAAGVASPSPEPPPTPTPAPPTPHPVLAATTLELGERPACVLVRSGERVLASHAPQTPLGGASTQKLFVAAAALQTLGPGHRLITTAVAEVAPVDGVLGNLWLVGGGDPLLATPEYAAYLAADPRRRELPPTSLAELADGLVAAGVRQIQGAVLGYDARHEPAREVPGSAPRHLAAGSITPLSALTVNGGLAAWTPQRTPVTDPAAHTAAELTRLLRERGVHVAGEGTVAPGPPGEVRLAEVSSAPMIEIAAAMLRSSDNLTAELLLREIGLDHAGEGSTAAGARAVLEILAAAGVDHDGVILADGSGLHPANRATCRSLADTVELTPAGVVLTDLLAVAGRSGTLRNRMAGTPLEGRLAAKTGWVSGMVGIAGRLMGAEPVTVVILQNQVPNLETGRTAEEQVLGALAGAHLN